MKLGPQTRVTSLSRCGAPVVLALGFSIAAAHPGHAQEPEPETRSGYEDVSNLGRSPSAISNELLSSDEERDSAFKFPRADALFEPWYEFKEDINERFGLQFGIAETAVYQRATESPGENNAAGGIFEIAGTWTLVGRDTPDRGFVGFKFESRHRFTNDIAPQDLAFEFGSAYPTAFGYGTFEFSPVELWWEQHLFDDRFAFRVGKMLPFAIFDYFALKSPKTGFTNGAFTLNPTIAFPSFGLGAAVGVYPTKELYFVTGIHDANAKPTKTKSAFDSFFNDSDYFKAAEVGFEPTLAFGEGSYHAMVWHVDERKDLGIPDDWGFALFGEQNVDDLLLFLRYGYSNDNASVLEHMIAGGVGFKNVLGRDNDLIGFGVSWGRIADFDDIVIDLDGDVFRLDAVDNDDQYAAELFYRVELTPRLTVTPSVQVILDPATNPDDDVVGVFGIRGQFAF